MKKILTLVFVSVFGVAVLAADHRPMVTLTTARQYEVVIDGMKYGSGTGRAMNVSLKNKRQHTIKVYELRGGLFSKQKRLVSSQTFRVGRNDVDITVNRFGQVFIREDRDFRYDDRNWNDRNGRDYDHRRY